MERGALPIEERARFAEIRYANCWEDAEVVASGLAPLAGARCLSIASAGDNSFSLLARGAAAVLAVDLSPAQMALVELKAAAFRELGHHELVAFLGAAHPPEAGGPARGERLRTYRLLRARLSPSAREFWDRRSSAIRSGLVHSGRLESYFRRFRRCVLPLIHDRATVAALFEPRDAPGRERFYDAIWDSWRWRVLFRLFFSRFVQGRFARDPEFLRFAPGALADPLLARTRVGLAATPPADNPYLRFILTGAFGETLPDYLLPERHQSVRAGLDRLRLQPGAVEDVVCRLEPESIDAFNLSDVAEYMDSGRFAGFLSALRRAAAPGARLAYWNLFVDRERPAEHAGWLAAHGERARRLHEQSRVFFYSRLVLEVVR